MAKQSKRSIVYSTNPDFHEEIEEVSEITLEPKNQNLRVRLETKQRNGKKATVVLGFVGLPDDLEVLSKSLKTKLSVGGSAKDGEIILQGDLVQKTKDLLISLGYTRTK
ncbi:MAG: translation initiation factor [Chitinophagales bacterium]|jgi:translation initiation factor 1|nr:translation initiation factor [Chitinophagales bacterium]